MGKGARWITRCSAALVLVGTVASAASTAFAYSAGGADVPDSTFRQGSGTQQVVVPVGPPLAGTDETLVVWPFYSSDDHWLVGVTADPGTGASCAYDVGQWQCTPGRSGWRAGDLRVLVNTAKGMDCGLHAGVCQNDEINIQGLPDAPDRNGLPDAEPFSAIGNVLIMPRSAPWQGAAAKLVYQSPPAAAPAGSASPEPTDGVDAVNTALTSTPSGSSTGLYLAVGIPVLLAVGGLLGYRTVRRRRAAAQG